STATPLRQPISTAASTSTAKPAVASTAKFRASGKKYQLTAIGTSTGGPVALQKILTRIPANYPHPIVLVQHMPATFTAAFASRLNTLCKIEVREAQDGDVLKSGVAYLAPGGKQMMVDGRAGSARLRIIDGGDRMNYKPCVDVTFGSAAKIYGDKVLSMILTGMGADGREGSRMLKTAGSTIWAQDEDSCVVYGMPQAVAKAGISTEDLPLDRIAERILVEVGLA
ncbi:chemotaxis-specific protein-glutamate methyltransferase CheB, partial [Vibrio sp. 10N.222.54.A1]